MKHRAKAVTPYSLVGETGGGVPALKHFFRMTERSGTAITDSKGGIVWDIAKQFGDPTAVEDYVPELLFDREGSSNTIQPNRELGMYPVPLTSGAWHTFDSTKASIVMCAGRVSPYYVGLVNTCSVAVRFAIGDINGYLYPDIYAGWGMSSAHHMAMGVHAVASSRVEDNPALPDTVFPPGTIIGATNYSGLPVECLTEYHRGMDAILVSAFKPGFQPTYNAIKLDDNVLQISAPVLSALSAGAYLHESAVAWQPAPCMRFSNIAAYGYAVFEFENGLPADYEMAVLWMAQEWKRGNRVIWPGWIGLL